MIERLRALRQPIRVGIVGAGAMGRGLLHQSLLTPGIQPIAIADIDLRRAVSVAETAGIPFRVVEHLDDMHDAVREGRLAVCTDGDLVARCELSQVFVESSSAILPAARYSIAALEQGQHLVLMNAEIDLIFGPEMLRIAREKGLTYTSCDGDQHGVIRRLIDEMTLWGFEPVMAGNIKGFLDRESNPTKIIPEADKRNLSYQMATAYTDGTKLCVEMSLLANALGYAALQPGMIGPVARDVHEVFDLFDFESIRSGGIPVVDYLLGAEPNGGVFAVGWCDHPYQRDMLAYYKMGSGPFYLFYRPYHLCHVEAMECIASTFLDGHSLLEPTWGLRTNVYAYAKTPLSPGAVLDGIGGYACYGMIENDFERTNDGLPICLAENVRLRRKVGQGEKISIADVDYDATREDFLLYQRARAAGSAAR